MIPRITTSRTTRKFREALTKVPKEIQHQAATAYRLFRENQEHPGLRFKKVHSQLPIYSVRINIKYRAVGVIEGKAIVWFWVGIHADYERLLKQL